MSTTHTPSVSPEFDPESESYTFEYDIDSSWEVSTAIVLSLSAITGVAPTAMQPLAYAVDPDVLDAHVGSTIQESTLTFEHHDHEITVRVDGEIELRPLD